MLFRVDRGKIKSIKNMLASAGFTSHIPVNAGKVGFEYVFPLLLMALYLVINGAGGVCRWTGLSGKKQAVVLLENFCPDSKAHISPSCFIIPTRS
jgi:hypothetical protein